ncbi:helix-turn-helix transcriptional regulator [Pseudoflavitalea sp. G-6-1-2]|nr:helix-turn-helix transcriptional regulator [Pseudoflavitalea sp. G-6-1-2]
MNEVLFPSGYLELSINISDKKVKIQIGEQSENMPVIEVLGHLLKPTRETVEAGTTILITRFYPHASSLFLHNSATEFTNHSTDLGDVLNQNLSGFYNQLMEQPTIGKKIKVLEAFLLKQLARSQKRLKAIEQVERVCNYISARQDSFDIKRIAKFAQRSERHLQKLFLDHVGLTPHALFAVQRFARSVHLIRTSAASLTDIGYECGYYDQTHFIKQFKSFTGVTPLYVKKETKKSW